jgi:prefoldin beta subunit
LTLDDTVQQLQLIEQALQQARVQKRALRAEMVEAESALEELTGNDEAWRLVGNILVRTDAEKLRSELSARRDELKAHIESLESQEERLAERAKGLHAAAREKADGSRGDAQRD